MQIRLFRTYTCPIIRSGMTSFSLRIFHRKPLRGIHNISKNATIPAIHFLFGALPIIETQIHIDVFALFFNIWRNPDSNCQYLLENSENSSRTWSINMKHLFIKYIIEDPLTCVKLRNSGTVGYQGGRRKASLYYLL